MFLDKKLAFIIGIVLPRFQRSASIFVVQMLIAMSCYGQQVITLDQAYILLEQQNLDVLQGKINLLIAKEDETEARNSIYPQVTFNVGHQYNLGLAFDEISGQLITGNKWSNMANAGLGLNAVLFQGFTRKNRIKTMALGVEGQELTLESLKRSLKLELLSLYFEALMNLSLHQIAVEQINMSKEQLIEQKTQFELGTTTMVDVSLAESQVATDEINVLVSMNSYRSTLLGLQQLLNIPYQDSIVLKTPDIRLLPSEGLPQTFESTNPNILLAQTRIKQAEMNIKQAKGSYLPTLSFFSNYGTNYSSERIDYITGRYMPFGDQINQNRALNIGLSLSVPVFDGFQTRSTIAKAKLTLQSQEKELEKNRQNEEKLLLTAIQEYEVANKEYNAHEIQYESLKNSFNATKERYAIGVSSSMDYAKSLLDYNISKLNLVRARYKMLYNQEVLRLLGGL